MADQKISLPRAEVLRAAGHPYPFSNIACDHDLPSSWGDLISLLSDAALLEMRALWGNYVPHDDRDIEMCDDLNSVVMSRGL